MTTRSGRGYKRQGMSSTETPHAVEESAGEGDGAEGGRLETSGNANPDIMAVVELLMQDRRRREEEIAEDRARRECEMERRVSEMKGQMETFCKMMERTGRGKTNPGEALVKVSKLADTDDIEGYLLMFERQMTAYEVDESRWAFILAPHLTGRAQKAYMAMASEDVGDYRQVKEAILQRYDISEETHRRKFRTRVRDKGESFAELATSLMDLVKKWLAECSSKEEVLEKLAIEQFLNHAPEDVPRYGCGSASLLRARLLVCGRTNFSKLGTSRQLHHPKLP